MPERDFSRGPGFWLGTFHAAMLTLVAVYLVYLGGGLGRFLGGVGTLAGLLAFAFLWGVSVWTTERAVRGLDIPDTPLASLLSRGIIWGAMAGLLIFAPFIPVTLVGVVVNAEGVQQALTATAFLVLFYSGIGGVVAGIVGGAMGFVFALIDALLLLASRRWATGMEASDG